MNLSEKMALHEIGSMLETLAGTQTVFELKCT